jgi:hypothetical protein
MPGASLAYTSNSLVEEVGLVVFLLLSLFVVREVFAWFTKNNSILETVDQLTRRLQIIEDLLQKLVTEKL